MTASNNPNIIDKNNRYYEHKGHIELVSYDDNGRNSRIIDIPLRMLRSSLARITMKSKKKGKTSSR